MITVRPTSSGRAELPFRPTSCEVGAGLYDLSAVLRWFVRPLGRVKSPTRTTSRSSEIPDLHDLQVVRISGSHNLQVVSIPDSPDLFCSRSRSRLAGFPIRTTFWSANFRFVRPLGRQTFDSYDLLVGMFLSRTTSWSAGLPSRTTSLVWGRFQFSRARNFLILSSNWFIQIALGRIMRDLSAHVFVKLVFNFSKLVFTYIYLFSTKNLA